MVVNPLTASSISPKLKVLAHKAEEGGYWAEVPTIPRCAT